MALSKFEQVPKSAAFELFTWKRIIEECNEDPFSRIESNACAKDVLKHLNSSSFDERFIEEYFPFYLKEFNVRNAADYVAHLKSLKNRSGRGESSTSCIINLILERRKFQPADTLPEEDRRAIRLDLYNAKPYLRRGTLYSEDAWRYFGGGSRLDYAAYKSCVRQVLDMCPGGIAIKVCEPSQNPLLQRQAELENMHKSLELGVSEGSIFRLRAYDDLVKISKYVSFDTISSWDCYSYLGERFKLAVSTRDGERDKAYELLQHLDLVTRLLEELPDTELQRMRGVPLKERLRIVIARKLDMVELRKRFGVGFCNWRSGRKDEDGELKHTNYALKMTIFWGLLYDQRKQSCTPSFEKVIRRLIADDLIAQKPTEHYRKVFLCGFTHYYDADYFLCTPDQFNDVKQYLTSCGSLKRKITIV